MLPKNHFKKTYLERLFVFCFLLVLDSFRFSWWIKKTMLATYLSLLIHYSSFSSDTKTLCTGRAQVPIFFYWLRISRECNVFHLWCLIKHKLRDWEVVQSTQTTKVLCRYYTETVVEPAGQTGRVTLPCCVSLKCITWSVFVSFAIKWRMQSLLFPQCFL